MEANAEPEVFFCDLCNTSVPQQDLDTGAAARTHDKIVGACCLTELRGDARDRGVALDGAPELHGLFANIENFPGDHIAVFVVRRWKRARTPRPNPEILEQGFIATEALPPATDAGTRRRVAEILDGGALGETW